MPIAQTAQSPNQPTEPELKLIRDMHRRNPKLGIAELRSRLRKRGYSRCIESLWRGMRRMGMTTKEQPKKKYRPKPYEQMQYSGQRGGQGRPVQTENHGNGSVVLLYAVR